MQDKLKNIIEKFKKSQNSLESYQAISEFMEIVIAVPEYIAQVEKEGEVIYQEKIKLNADKGWNYGLGGKELKEHNKWRDRKSKALHELDPLFPLRNLNNVYEGIKPENILACSDWLYRFQSPDEPLPEDDKEEYQMFLDKVFKKVIPFLKVEKTETENPKVKFYDEEKRVLHIGNYEISIAKNEGNNNAHEIMAYIFIDNKDSLKDKLYYAEIAEKRFEADYNRRNKYAYQPYSGTCKRINQIIKDATDSKIKDFLILNYSTLGHIEINPKYL